LASPSIRPASLRDFDADLRDKKVEVLVIVGRQPGLRIAPVDLNLPMALLNSGAGLRLHHGLHQDETAELCQWHVNAAHSLEAWAMGGRMTDRLPCATADAPLYEGRARMNWLRPCWARAMLTGH